MTNEINPFDIASGKVVQNKFGTFWFKEPGHNMKENGCPIFNNLHRDNDQPAIILADRRQCWYKNGKQHRDGDQPAAIYANGDKEWYKNGKLHRDNDLPAVIRPNGSQGWYKNGEPIKKPNNT